MRTIPFIALAALASACTNGDTDFTNTNNDPDVVIGNGRIQVDPAELVFADIVEAVTIGQDLTITSIGKDNLVVEDVAIYNSGSGTFYTEEQDDITLEVGQSRVIQVTAMLGKPSQASGSIRIRCNDPDTPSVMVDLTAWTKGWVPTDTGDTADTGP